MPNPLMPPPANSCPHPPAPPRWEALATLASQAQGYGNVKLSPEQQAAFVEDLPGVFLPVHGGWGRMGMTHVRLAAVTEDVLEGALRSAWKLRLDRNAKSGKKSHSRAKPSRASNPRQKRG